MKIAMIGHKRIPSREGGVEIVVEALSRRMVQRATGSPFIIAKAAMWPEPPLMITATCTTWTGYRSAGCPPRTAKSSMPLCTAFLPQCGRCSWVRHHSLPRRGSGGYGALGQVLWQKNAWSPFMAWTGSGPSGAALPPAFSALASVWLPSMQTRSSCCLPVCSSILLTPITAKPCGLKTALTHRRRRTCPLCPALDWKRTAISCFSVALSRRRASTI